MEEVNREEGIDMNYWLVHSAGRGHENSFEKNDMSLCKADEKCWAN